MSQAVHPMPSTDYVRIGKIRVSRSKFKRRVYQIISIVIALLFVSSLVYMILFGRNPGS